jgi:hypothetical protein
MATNVTRTRRICLAAVLGVQLLGQTAPLAQTASANADLIASAKARRTRARPGAALQGRRGEHVGSSRHDTAHVGVGERQP